MYEESDEDEGEGVEVLTKEDSGTGMFKLCAKNYCQSPINL